MKPYEIKYGQDARNEVRDMSEIEIVTKMQAAKSTANMYQRLYWHAINTDVQINTVLDLKFGAGHPKPFTWHLPSVNQADAYQVITNEISFARWQLDFIEKFGNAHMTEVVELRPDIIRFNVSNQQSSANVKYYHWHTKYYRSKGNWTEQNTAE